MLTSPQASILIVGYNAGSFIGKALSSIKEQTLTDWELVVIEDGSKDETEKEVKKFSQNVVQPVKYLNNGENKGVSVSRTRSLQESSGNFVAFLDADDWWEPQHLANASKLFEDQQIGLAYSAINILDSQSETIKEIARPNERQLSNPLNELFLSSFIQTSSCVALSRKAIERVGSFDPLLSVGEDRDYWLRCAEAGFRLGYTNDATCNYLKHPNNTMSKTLKVSAQTVAFYRKRHSSSLYPVSLRKRLLAESLITQGRLERKDNARKAKKAFTEAWKLSPFNYKAALGLALTLVR